MKIINNIEIDNPNQWIERFVEQVLENAGIDCEQALIEEIEEEKRILLSAGVGATGAKITSTSLNALSKSCFTSVLTFNAFK